MIHNPWNKKRAKGGIIIIFLVTCLYISYQHIEILGYLCMPSIMLTSHEALGTGRQWIDALLTLNCPVLTYERFYGSSNAKLYSGSRLLPDHSTELTMITDSKEGKDRDRESDDEGIIPVVQADSGNHVEADATIVPTAEGDINQNLTIQPVYSIEQFSDFSYLMNYCYTVDSTTYVDANEMNAKTLLSMDMTMQQDNSDYQILIYHTHSSSETFADSRPGVIEDTPVGLGDTLTSLLEGYGYKVYHDRTVYDQIDGRVDRNYAYTASGEAIDRILNEHPSIEVVIDLHRDGLNPHTHLVTEINGKQTAKIMFFNGVSRTVRNGELDYLHNPNRQANLAFSLQMYLTGEAMYDDYLRNIYIKGYQYNLDRRPKATLIEVGGQTNTVEEANNAMEPLAAILNQVLSGEKVWE